MLSIFQYQSTYTPLAEPSLFVPTEDVRFELPPIQRLRRPPLLPNRYQIIDPAPKIDLDYLEDRDPAFFHQSAMRRANQPPRLPNRSTAWHDLENTFIAPAYDHLGFDAWPQRGNRMLPPKTRSRCDYGAEPLLSVPPEDISADKWLVAWPQPRIHPRTISRSGVFLTSIAATPIVSLLGDSLRLFLTGAASDGGAQANQAASLGNYRSSTEASRIGWIYTKPLKGISIAQASRANGVRGVGTIFAVDADHVRYAGPNSNLPGESVAITNGQSVTVQDDDDPNQWLRITRTSASDLSGFGTLEFVDQFNNVFGFSNADNTESTSGGDRYRAVMISNVATIDVGSVKLYVGTLGTAAVSSAGQLGGSGAGTITFAANALVDWPWQGWARIVQSGGTLREIVYYSSRTSNVLTVPSLGRGRLGTSAGAGGATDTVYPVPGIRIAYEAAVANAVQTIANESSAPSGVSWSTAITSAAGISVGTLTAGMMGALWIHRELPAGVSAFPEHRNAIKLDYTVEGVSYSETLSGLFRIAVTASERYEIYYTTGSMPEIDGAPDETTTTLPYETTGTFGNGTHYIVTQFRNRYGMVTESLDPTILTVSSGATATNPPSPPEVISFEAGASGVGTLKAVYFYDRDALAAQADTLLIYLTSNGATPTPGVDSPTLVSLVKVGGSAHVTYSTAQFSTGTTLKILLRTRRAADTSDSESTAVYTVTADATSPAAASGSVHWRAVAEQDQ